MIFAFMYIYDNIKQVERKLVIQLKKDEIADN